MAKDNETSGNQVTSSATGQTFGPAEDERSADAYPDAASAVSRDAKDYVLVTRYTEDGLRLEVQVPKNSLGEGDYEGVSLEDDNVKEAHPAVNRPTSDLTEEEAEDQGRTVGRG